MRLHTLYREAIEENNEREAAELVEKKQFLILIVMDLGDNWLREILKNYEGIPKDKDEGNGLYFKKKFVFNHLPKKTLNFAASSIKRMTMVEKNMQRTVK